MADTVNNQAKMPTKQKGTGFSNIQNIVSANRQNRLGQTVSSGVGSVVGKSQQDISAAREQFQQGAQQGALGTAADQAYAQQTIQQAGQGGANPSQADTDRFAKLRSGMYQGPTQLGNKEQLMAQGADIKGLGQAATGEYGRRGLLQRFVAPDQYTQGQQRLDTLLLGQTGGQALSQARRQANLYGQQLGQAQQSAQAQAQGLTQQAQQFGQNLQKQLASAQQAQEQDLASRQLSSENQAKAAREALYSLLSKPTSPAIDPGSYSTMPVGGTKPTITQQTYDLARPLLEQLGSDVFSPEYFTSSPEIIVGDREASLRPLIEQVASESDKARASALAKLSGRQQEFLTGDVGGYDPLSFLDKNRFNEVVNKSRKSYDEFDALNKTKEYLSLADAQMAKSAPIIGSASATPLNSQQLGGSPLSLGQQDDGSYLLGTNDSRDNTNAYRFDKDNASQLKQNFDQFINNYNQAKNTLSSQGLDTTNFDDTPTFESYLRSLRTLNQDEFGRVPDGTYNRNAYQTVTNRLAALPGEIRQRADVGASSNRLALLERLKSLIQG